MPASTTIRLAFHDDGIRPSLVITPEPPMKPRGLEALAHEFAAKALRATPEGELWGVKVRMGGPQMASVELDLFWGDAREHADGMEVLRRIAE